MRYPEEGFDGGRQKLCTYICNKTLNYSIHLKLKLYFFFERTFFVTTLFINMPHI